jgi:hypothetical protein
MAAQEQNKATLLNGLLNVTEWISSFNAAIENIDKRETLKRLKRELSYLSTDINEITNSKKNLMFKATKPEATVGDYNGAVQDLQNDMRIFKERFTKINQLVPSEFKLEENPLTQNIDNLIWGKLETLEKIKTVLYGDNATNWEVMQELNDAIEITKKIEFQINALKLAIEKKLE